MHPSKRGNHDRRERDVLLAEQASIFTYYEQHGLFEHHLIEWCKQFCDPAKQVIDIGAHTGTYSVSLAKCCQHVHSFEPQRMTYYALCGSVALSGLSNITCHQCGLGSPAQVGEMDLSIISVDGGGSSVQPQAEDIILCMERICIKTLDDFSLTSVSFIKMDVEDNERFVLQGAKRTLANNGYPPVLFESNTRLSSPNDQLLVETMRDVGYTRITSIQGYPNMFLAER